MEGSFAKVLGFVFFIFLGWFMRRTGMLKDDAFHTVAPLVINVTIPAVIITHLNGIKIESTLLTFAAIGLATNLLLLAWAWILARKESDPRVRDFKLLNIGGYSCGPFALPYVQAFFPTTGVLTVCLFDVGNVMMSGGGTYALIAGTREKTSPLATVKAILSRLMQSGPFVSFLFMMVLAGFGIVLPKWLTDITGVAAQANTFLCMLMIGLSIRLDLTSERIRRIAGVLAARWAMCILFAVVAYQLLPFEEEYRIVLALICLSPIPAMNLIFTAKLGADLPLAAVLSSVSVACSITAMSVALAVFGVI